MKKCATWDCKGKLIEDGDLLLKCFKCGRGYWNIEKLKSEDKQ